MDKPSNWTHGEDSITQGDQNCVSNFSSSSFDKLLITAPSWNIVNQDLKWMFLLHSYGFGCLFVILSFYTFFSLLNLRSLISSRPFMSTINIFLCLLGISRSSCLFIDPYNLKEMLPKVIGSIVWDIGFPFLTSAFCLIQLAFLQLTQIFVIVLNSLSCLTSVKKYNQYTKPYRGSIIDVVRNVPITVKGLKFGPEKFQKESCLTLIIISHFSCIIVSDIALAFHNHYITKYVVQTIFLIWSILLYTTFLHAGYKVMQLLRSMPISMLMHDNTNVNQKGIMQLAILAPYNNLATSVAAALVPTLLGPKLKEDTKKSEEADNANTNGDTSCDLNCKGVSKMSKILEEEPKQEFVNTLKNTQTQSNSTVPEVYVRPPTPTPSTAILPIITVSSPSRRSSLASRRGSDVTSRASSRRSSECSVRFNNEESEKSPVSEQKRNCDVNRTSPMRDRSITPENPTARRYSESITPLGSNRDLRRCSDFTHEKNRCSQFATKLRRNSDFGNRVPKRMMQVEEERLPKVLDISPTGSRRNSDISGLMPAKSESRRNSDIAYRRNSEWSQIKPLTINRRSSDISIKSFDRSPTHYQNLITEKNEIQERSESDSDQPDCSEKAALMTEKSVDKNEDNKVRKKSLSWKNEKNKEEDITIETSLLTDATATGNRVMSSDFTLHSILNHIAYVNRAKTDIPLHISEATIASARKSQIRRVLNITYATAILGIILCIADFVRIFGPYGLLAEVIRYGTKPLSTQLPKPWPWLLYQTFCRGLEFLMGCAMANITKQPSASPRHQYLNNYHNYSMRIKQRNNNLYI